jgi:hypothetical protein
LNKDTFEELRPNTLEYPLNAFMLDDVCQDLAKRGKLSTFSFWRWLGLKSHLGYN